MSAVGKTYYKNILVNEFKINQLKRVTTRKKREVEENIADCYISKEEFKSLRKSKDVFIYSKINNEYYAYLNSEIEDSKCRQISIGDCYYKLLKKIKKKLKDRLIIVCIQPKDFEYTKAIITKQRDDYKKRIKQANKEYRFFKKNESLIDYLFYTEYNDKTKNEIVDTIGNIIKNI